MLIDIQPVSRPKYCVNLATEGAGKRPPTALFSAGKSGHKT